MIHPGRKASWYTPVADSAASPEFPSETPLETGENPLGHDVRYWNRARYGASVRIVTTDDDGLREVEDRRQSLRPQSLLGGRGHRPLVLGTPHGGKPA